MAQLAVPSAPKEYATQYRMLLGVDFQADQTEVDRRRSPDMVNLISDFGGNPVKRDGYRKVAPVSVTSLIRVGGVTYAILASETEVRIGEVDINGYILDGNEVGTLTKNIGEVKGAFAYQRTIYIIGTKCMMSFNTETYVFNGTGIGAGMMSTGAVGETEPATDQTLNDSIPDVLIDLKPDGTGGSVLDDKNVFSIYQRVSYKGDGSTKEFVIPNYICTKMGTWVKVEVMNSSGEWEVKEEPTDYTLETSSAVTGLALDGELYETNNIIDAKVTFTTAPLQPVGEDNVRITFAPYSMEIVNPDIDPNGHKGYYNETLVKLLSSPAVAFQNGRLFLSDSYKVYYSDVSNPYMISDLAWFDIDSEVVSFTRSNSSLAILAKDNGKGTIYLANEMTRVVDSQNGTTETYYVVKESNAGVGAIAPKCVATLSDEPMFLSNTGLYGILTNWQSEKYAVNRSSRINRKLCKEPNLDKAVGIAFNDYFYLAVNGRMYVLDGRHKESDRAGNKPLEAYYFEGLPAIENMFVIGGRMYFTDGSYTYTWNDDLPDTERYLDDAYVKKVTSVDYQLGLIYNEETGNYYEEPTGEWLDTEPIPDENEVVWYRAEFDDLSEEISIDKLEVDDVKLTGKPVRCRWCSTFDDDGAPQRLKTLMKKGTMVTLVPHYKSGCEITLVKDGDVFEYLGSFDTDLQSFEYIAFDRFTFNANTVAFDEFTKKKIKKYKRLQIQIENNKAEPFGLTQITKTYIFGNYAKR